MTYMMTILPIVLAMSVSINVGICLNGIKKTGAPDALAGALAAAGFLVFLLLLAMYTKA